MLRAGQVLSSRLGYRPRWQFSHRTLSTFPDIPIFRSLAAHDPQDTALYAENQAWVSYGSLLSRVEKAKVLLFRQLKAVSNGKPVGGQRIAFLAENGEDYIVTLLAILACDGIAVPISSSFPDAEVQHIIATSETGLVIAKEDVLQRAKALWLRERAYLNIDELRSPDVGTDDIQLIELPISKGGLILFTSGTTDRPKGAFLTNANLAAQAKSLIQAWALNHTDHLLHVLPLHHIHGVVNAIIAPLTAGATIEFLRPFNAEGFWRRLAATVSPRPISVITAVPTIYQKLATAFNEQPSKIRNLASQAILPINLRLNMSGSASLPTPLQEQWTRMSHGNMLLERYGMTETGMILSCGLNFADRPPQAVGWPLPNVQVRLVDESGNVIDGNNVAGEIQVRGPLVFSHYWNNEEATQKAFLASEPGQEYPWFQTGDVAVRRMLDGTGTDIRTQGPCYFILGRSSTDIIKSGGEKISALEVERELISLPEVREAAVIGVHSEAWGQKVVAVIVLQSDVDTDYKLPTRLSLRRALAERLAPHKLPQDLRIIREFRRNAMGKINKKQLAIDLGLA